MQTAMERVEWYLHLYHPNYTLSDVAVSEDSLSLYCLKPCPRTNMWPSCGPRTHFHTIGMRDEHLHNSARNGHGRFTSQKQLGDGLAASGVLRMTWDEWKAHCKEHGED